MNATESPGLPGRALPAGRDTSRPLGAAALLERLAAVEAGIRDDRHRQPAAVVETIATLWAAGETVSAIAAGAGVSPHIVRDRLRRAGVFGSPCRDQRRHVREVLEQQGARLIAAYEASASVQALAARAGISGTTLREYLIAEGVTLHHGIERVRTRLDTRGAEIIATYEAGATIEAIAAGAGICGQTIRAYLVAHGVEIRSHRRQAQRILETRGAELIAAYKAGTSLNALAADAGIAPLTVRAYLVAHGVVIRDSRRRVQEILEARGDELIAAYEAGMTQRALAADAGIGGQSLRAFLVSRGITIRRRSIRAHKIPDARAPELIAAYEAGASLNALAAEAGVCSATLSTFLVARGVRLRHDRGWYRRSRPSGG